MEVVQSPEVHDVVVVGSGASGGMAAYNLTQQGVKVLMLDAGDKFERDKFWTHVLPFEADERLRRGDTPPPFYLDKQEQPYVTPEWQAVQLDPGVGARRQDERVGPSEPAHVRPRLQSRGA